MPVKKEPRLPLRKVRTSDPDEANLVGIIERGFRTGNMPPMTAMPVAHQELARKVLHNIAVQHIHVNGEEGRSMAESHAFRVFAWRTDGRKIAKEIADNARAELLKRGIPIGIGPKVIPQKPAERIQLKNISVEPSQAFELFTREMNRLLNMGITWAGKNSIHEHLSIQFGLPQEAVKETIESIGAKGAGKSALDLIEDARLKMMRNMVIGETKPRFLGEEVDKGFEGTREFIQRDLKEIAISRGGLEPLTLQDHVNTLRTKLEGQGTKSDIAAKAWNRLPRDMNIHDKVAIIAALVGGNKADVVMYLTKGLKLTPRRARDFADTIGIPSQPTYRR
ncbi:MAG: hypothetical protein JW834_03235 [Candidatus Diapherotrites archaeon]|nr:hypothetical protein [Candidatus Diapherotrites archaeon]